jgi:F-type H+-transporting ATPase subunit delta
MRIQPVAYRYARSLLDLALEQGQLKQVHEDITLVADTCAHSQELRTLLKSPVMRADKKQQVLHKALTGRIGRIVFTFITVLVRKGREPLLHEIAAAFEELHRVHEGVVICTVTSTVELSDEEREKVMMITQPRFPGKTIRIESRIDPSIIGGGIIQVGDLQWDASVRNQLHVIRRKLAENPYIPKI